MRSADIIAGFRFARRFAAAGAVLLATILTVAGCLGDGSSGGKQPDMSAGGASAPQAKPEIPRLVATYRDVPPDMLTYSPGRHSGPLRYVIEEAAGRIGYGIEWRPAPFGESLDKAKSGDVDIVPFVRFKTEDREKVFRFSESMGKVKAVTFFLQHADDPQPIRALEDLRGRTVGYRPGSFYYEEFMPDTRFKKAGFPDDGKLIKGFIDRKVNVVVVNIPQATERALAAAGYGASNYKYAELVIERETEMYMLYTRAAGRQEVFDRLDQALVKMREEGLIEDIYKSFEADPPRRQGTE